MRGLTSDDEGSKDGYERYVGERAPETVLLEMALQTVAVEASEAHLEPQRHGHVARSHESRCRRHGQRRYHDHHEPDGPHRAPHPLRQSLPSRSHLPPFHTGSVSDACNKPPRWPHKFRRSPPAEAYEPPPPRMRRGNPRARGAGLGTPAPPSGFRPPGRRARNREAVEEEEEHGEQRKRRRGRREEGEKEKGGTGRGRVLMEQCFVICFLFFIVFCCSLAGLVNCCANAGCDCDWVIKIIFVIVW